MLAVHIDDGLDNPIATENLRKLVEKTGVTMVTIQPDMAEYRDVLRSLLKGSLPNLAIAQDNLIVKALQDYAKENRIRYSLDGNNIAHESIWSAAEGLTSMTENSSRPFKRNSENSRLFIRNSSH